MVMAKDAAMSDDTKVDDGIFELLERLDEVAQRRGGEFGLPIYVTPDILELQGVVLDAFREAERNGEARLAKFIDTPHTKDFMEAVPLEAAHQIKRWGVEHDDGKAPEDWFWLVGYLAGKCLRAASDYERTGDERDLRKAKHHTISTAAVLLNWFRRLNGDDDTFRPGISAPSESTESPAPLLPEGGGPRATEI